MESIPSSICSGLSAIGGNCAANVLIINVWHLLVGLFVFSSTVAIFWFFRRNARLDRQHQVQSVNTPYGASPESRTLRLNPHALAIALKEPGYEALSKTDAAAKLNKKYGHRYFVVQFREGGRKLLSKEMKVVALVCSPESGPLFELVRLQIWS